MTWTVDSGQWAVDMGAWIHGYMVDIWKHGNMRTWGYWDRTERFHKRILEN